MMVNVDTGKIDKEHVLKDRGYWCSGCEHYYDESNTVCKNCPRYLGKL